MPRFDEVTHQKNVKFRLIPTYNSTYANRYVRYREGSVTLSNDVLTFNGSSNRLYYYNTQPIRSIRIICTPNSTTQNLIKLNATQSIRISSGTVTATGFTGASIFVNGVRSSTFTGGKADIVVTSGQSNWIYPNDLIVGFVSSYFNGTIEMVELSADRWADLEVKAMYDYGDIYFLDIPQNNSFVSFNYEPRVYANGGSLSPEMLASYAVFDRKTRFYGLRTRHVRRNAFLAREFTGALVPFYLSKDDNLVVGNAVDVKAVNFEEGTTPLSSYAVNQGITGNGSGYLNTGVVPSGTSELGLNSSGLMCYYNSLNNTARQLIGCNDSVGTTCRFLLQVNNVTKAYVSYNNDITGIATTYVNEPNLMLMYRNNSLNYKRLGNGISIATITATTTAKPDYAIFVFSNNNTNVSSIPTSQSFATYGITDSIANDAEAEMISKLENEQAIDFKRNTYI